MNFTNKVLLFLLLVLIASCSFSKIYLGEVIEELDYKNSTFTINQLDSTAGFEVVKSVNMGEARFLKKTYSPSGKFLVVYLVKKNNRIGELIIYKATGLEEFYRQKIHMPSESASHQLEVYFNKDESIILVPNKHVNNERRINAYTINDGKLLYSYQLPKKGSLIGQSLSKETYYLGSKNKPRGYSSIEVIDLRSGKMLNKLEKKRTRYTYQKHLLENLFVSSYENKRKSYEHELITLDNESGKVKLKEHIGKIKPVFATRHKNNSIYFLAKVEETGELQINQLVDEKIVKHAHLQSVYKPTFMLVSEHSNKFLIAGEKSYILVDGEKKKSSKLIHRPFNIGSGFFSHDDSLVYLRQVLGGTSKVAIVDFENNKTVNISGTGSKVAKFEIIVASVASAAVTSYLTGYMYVKLGKIGTKMLLSNDEKTLYVLNKKTNDITTFNAKNLSNRHSVSTGLGTFGVFQLGAENFSNNYILVLSQTRISYFNHSTTEKVKEIKFKNLLNFDIDEDLVFSKNKNGMVNVHKLSNGELVKSFKKVNHLDKVGFFTPSQKQ